LLFQDKFTYAAQRPHSRQISMLSLDRPCASALNAHCPLRQIGGPLIVAAVLISLLSLAWSEYIVPGASLQAHYIDKVQIKNKKFRGHFNEAEIWYHGQGSFTNINRFDANRNEIYGLTRYEFDAAFQLRRIVQDGSPAGPATTGAPTRSRRCASARTDARDRTDRRSELKIDETPEDFTAVHRDAEDLSYQSCRARSAICAARASIPPTPRSTCG